jgi:hypothetical protein
MGCAALVLTATSPAKAAFVVGGENGWQMSFDGMINAFMVYTMQGNVVDRHGNTLQQSATQGFSDRTGLLPSIFAFNVKSPTIAGVDYGVRIGLYPQIQNNHSRTGFGPDTIGNLDGGGGSRIDIREVFFTADGKFGQFLIGRALNLYEGKNILTDMTLIGVGVPLDTAGAGTTLGNIGYGYTYPSFGSQFRYTTPDLSGLKIALAVADPSRLGSADGNWAEKTNQPRFEMEMSYAKSFGAAKMQAWTSALYQQAQFAPTHHKVASIGGAGGAQVVVGPVEMLVSGFGGKAVGMLFCQDGIAALDDSAIDNVGKERVTYGGLAHVTYTVGPVKIGAQYGINYADRTDNDVLQVNNGTDSVKKSQQAVTGGVYYSLNKYLTIVGEYTWARDSWYNSSARTDKNIISLGTVFTW